MTHASYGDISFDSFCPVCNEEIDPTDLFLENPDADGQFTKCEICGQELYIERHTSYTIAAVKREPVNE